MKQQVDLLHHNEYICRCYVQVAEQAVREVEQAVQGAVREVVRVAPAAPVVLAVQGVAPAVQVI